MVVSVFRNEGYEMQTLKFSPNEKPLITFKPIGDIIYQPGIKYLMTDDSFVLDFTSLPLVPLNKTEVILRNIAIAKATCNEALKIIEEKEDC